MSQENEQNYVQRPCLPTSAYNSSNFRLKNPIFFQLLPNTLPTSTQYSSNFHPKFFQLQVNNLPACSKNYPYFCLKFFLLPPKFFSISNQYSSSLAQYSFNFHPILFHLIFLQFPPNTVLFQLLPNILPTSTQYSSNFHPIFFQFPPNILPTSP